jgi:phosphotransferase system enzyme I (PtsI)
MIIRRTTLPSGTGLHARPATQLVEAIVASERPVRVRRPGGPWTDGRSVLRVLGLAIQGGEDVELGLDTAQEDAEGMALLDRLIASLTGGHSQAAPEPGRRLTGRSASRGSVVGVVYRIPDRTALDDLIREDSVIDAERRARAAFASVEADLRGRAGRVTGAAREVLLAGARIAADPDLHASVAQRIDGGLGPAQAIIEAVAEFRTTLAQAGGELSERVADLDDVRDRAVAACSGHRLPGLPDRREPYVLVARELAPADAALLDPAVVLAIVTIGGGPTGHTAILARELGIPAVVACPDAATLESGTRVAVHGSEGIVEVDPVPAAVTAVRGAPLAAANDGRGGLTADGLRVALLANLGDPARASAARDAGAEGVGLLRTEFCFAGRSSAPTVAEQVAAYAEVTRAFAGARIVVRLLDAGSDKPLSYLSRGAEPNPALGVRGLRALRAAPDVLRNQLAAIADVTKAGDAEIWTMAPMVTTAEEARWFADAAHAAGLPHVGVMIEVPAAALAAADVLRPLQFASVGTNDLAQYVFAADRGVAELARLQDPWHPALLTLVRMTAEAGVAAGKPVGVCGEAAGDPELALVLVGLGITSLSMAISSLPDVRARLRSVTADRCRELAGIALAADGAEAARAAVLTALRD